MTSRRVHALGRTLEVIVDAGLDGAVLEPLADLPEPDETRDADNDADRVEVRRVRLARDRWTVTGPRDSVARRISPALAVHEALVQISRSCAAWAARDHTVLHGAAVEISGRAVAFVGASGAGKSTAAAVAVRRGHGYISDEVSAVADDGAVEPFHRPIGLRPATASLLATETDSRVHSVVFPHRVGTDGRLAGRTPLALVVLVERDQYTPAEVIEEQMAPATALFEMTNTTIGATGMETAMFRRLESLVRAVPVVRVRNVDAEQLIPSVERWLG